MQIRIQKLSDTAIEPSRGSVYAAGYDLYADIPQKSVIIAPHETAMIDTGLAMEIPEGYFGAIYARSGLAAKSGLRPANCVGVIDADYRGPVKVALHNDCGVERTVNSGERIAQIVIQPCLDTEFVTVDTLSDTERGSGGFGSTGKA